MAHLVALVEWWPDHLLEHTTRATRSTTPTETNANTNRTNRANDWKSWLVNRFRAGIHADEEAPSVAPTDTEEDSSSDFVATSSKRDSLSASLQPPPGIPVIDPRANGSEAVNNSGNDEEQGHELRAGESPPSSSSRKQGVQQAGQHDYDFYWEEMSRYEVVTDAQACCAFGFSCVLLAIFCAMLALHIVRHVIR